jgi:hypothetical protein
VSSKRGPATADMLDDFAFDIERQIEQLEDAAEDFLERIERLNGIAAATMSLIASMRREAARVREWGG